MQINEGEMIVFKSKNYENNYFTSEKKKDKETGEYVKGTDGKDVTLYKTVYLPEGTDIGNSAKIKFKGYEAISITNDGTVKEYITVQEILEMKLTGGKPAGSTNTGYEFGADDDLPF